MNTVKQLSRFIAIIENKPDQDVWEMGGPAQWCKCWGARKLANLQFPVWLSTNSPRKSLFHPTNDSIPTLYGTSFKYIKFQFDQIWVTCAHVSWKLPRLMTKFFSCLQAFIKWSKKWLGRHNVNIAINAITLAKSEQSKLHTFQPYVELVLCLPVAVLGPSISNCVATTAVGYIGE